MPSALGVLGLPIGLGSLVAGLLSGLSAWVAAGAGQLVTELGGVLTTTTEPPLGTHFDRELTLITHFAEALVPILLMVTVIEAIIRQDLSLIIRTALLRVPLALLGSAAAIEIVLLLMQVTDSLSASVISLSGNSASHFVDAMAASLTSVSGIATGGFESVVLALALSVVATLLWVELIVRGAAISIALLFLPLALAGVVFSGTAHWARRLAETLFALVISKLVIASVLSLAVSSIGAPEGPSGLVEGVALLLLAALAPFVVLRLLPMVESGAIGHLEGTGLRGARLARDAFAAVPLSLAADDQPRVGPLSAPDLGWLTGVHHDDPGFDAEVERVERELRSPAPGGNQPGSTSAPSEESDA